MVGLSTGILLSLTLLQPAAATFNWGLAQPYQNPLINDNICSDIQKGGFDWQGLGIGKVSNFGGFDFSGFSCQNSFTGRKARRTVQTRAPFQQKVIEGKCTADQTTAPKVSCAPDKNFSIKEMQVTVEFDADIDFVYDMPDGTSCKQTQRCSAAGTQVANTQCGGARSVTFQVPSNGRECGIGIHRIDFDCDKGAPPPPPPPPPPPTSTSSTTSSTTSSVSNTTTPATTTTNTTLSTTLTSTTSSSTSTTTSSTCDPCSSSTTSSIITTLTSSTTSSLQTTSSTTTTTTTTPATTASTTSISTTIPTTGPSTTTTPPSTLQTTTTTTTSSAQPPPPPPPPPQEDAPCPPTLPRCLNTWLSLTTCKSNSDIPCMCANAEYTKAVISCVSCWSTSDAETQAALSYLAGICAAFIPQNPGICTNVPTSITLIPTISPVPPPATSGPSTSTSAIQPPPVVTSTPCTTVTFTNIITTNPATTITQTSTVTVPLVTFVTGAETITPTATGTGAPAPQAVVSVGLVPCPTPAAVDVAGPALAPAPAPAAPSAAVSSQAAPSSSMAAQPQGSPATASASGPVASFGSTTTPGQPVVSAFTGGAVREMGMGVLGVVCGVVAFLV